MPQRRWSTYRIDRRVKARALKTFVAIGLSVSDAVRVLLTRVAAEKALPFEVKVQNAAIVAAIQEARKRRLPAFNTVSDLMADLNAEDWGEPTPSAATSGATSEVDIGAIWIGLFHPWFLC